jgi:hypothetical protein
VFFEALAKKNATIATVFFEALAKKNATGLL